MKGKYIYYVYELSKNKGIAEVTADYGTAVEVHICFLDFIGNISVLNKDTIIKYIFPEDFNISKYQNIEDVLLDYPEALI